MWMRRALVLSLILVLAACTNDDASVKASTPSATSTDGPIHALTGQGGTIGPGVAVGQRLQTTTFGTQLCSDDDSSPITIDEVRYETKPLLNAGDGVSSDGPSIGTWFRIIPPPSPGVNTASPIISVAGVPDDLDGIVTELGDGYTIPATHGCDGYFGPHRTWPILEMLTVVTVDAAGSVANRTFVDYHVGPTKYTIQIDWKVGSCGTSIPKKFGCSK